MPDSREKWPRWRRIAGMLLFDASLVATTLGIARLVFGAGIDVGPGPSISLGPGGPWPPLILAAVLFVAAASLKPGRVRAESADDRALGADGVGAQIGSLGAGPPDLVSPVRDPTPLPRQRTDAGS